jgi:polysaccharide biosynthesis transport protein
MEKFKNMESSEETQRKNKSFQTNNFILLFRKNCLLLFLIIFLALITNIIFTFFIVAPKYTAETSIMVQVDHENLPSNELSAIYVANDLMGTYSEFIVSNTVIYSLKQEVEALEKEPIEEIKKMISIYYTEHTLMIFIRIQSESPELSAKIANSLARISIDLTNNIENPYELLQNKLSVLDEAVIPTKPSSPIIYLNILIASIIGSLIGILIIYVKDYFIGTFYSVDELKLHSNKQILTVVPKYQIQKSKDNFTYKSLIYEAGNSFEAEAYRKLDLNITLAKNDNLGNVIQITSTAPKDGKTTTSINLAKALKETNKKVLIVDLDLRRPKIHLAFDKPNKKGVYDYIFEDKSIEEIVIEDESRIDLLLTGRKYDNPYALLQSQKIIEMFKELKKTYDYVIIDSPPILGIDDTLLISRFSDFLVYVVKYNHTKKRDFKYAIQNFENLNINFLGIVFTDVNMKKIENKYSYYYFSLKEDSAYF